MSRNIADSSNNQKPVLKFLDNSLRLSVIPLSVATIWLTVTNKEDNSIYGEVKFSNLMGLYVISAGYALVASVANWIRCLVTIAWFFFVSDEIVAYLMVTSGAAVMEILYLAYNGDQKITWSEACRTYGKFCNKIKGGLDSPCPGSWLLHSFGCDLCLQGF
ncbi:hypothetical protein CRYUN_Cryun39dG0019300 [Craigia yunnanensis]